jgi:undecaprenyl-diphosphatase
VIILIVGTVVSFIVSMLVIRILMDYVRRHSFAAFGWYRIGLGVVVLVYFLVADDTENISDTLLIIGVLLLLGF